MKSCRDFGELVDIGVRSRKERRNDPPTVVGELIAVSFGNFLYQAVGTQEGQFSSDGSRVAAYRFLGGIALGIEGAS